MKISIINDNTRCKTIDGSLEHLHQIVQLNTWSPSVFNDSKRNQKNFQSADVIVFDIDENLSCAEAVERLRNKGLNYSITFTRNHQRPKGDKCKCDRFRILIPLTKPILDSESFFDIIRKAYSLMFPEADSQCLEPARMYYPSSSPLNTRSNNLFTNGRNLEPENDLILSLKEALLIDPEVKEEYKLFLKNPEISCSNHTWNNTLSRFALSLSSKGYGIKDIESLFSEIAPNSLTTNDLAAINSAYNKGKNCSRIKIAKKPIRFDLLFPIIKENLKDIMIFETPEKIKQILNINEKKEVTFISKESFEMHLTKLLTDLDLFTSYSSVRNFANFYLSNIPPSKKLPPLLSFSKDPGVSFWKVDAWPTEGESPIFNEFLSRCSCPDQLSAFIWSIFENDADTQQYLWIYGEGGDGKGSIARFLHKLIGKTYCSETSSGARDDKHYSANFLEKRLAVYPDNKCKTLPNEDIFKMLTGGDAIKINPKFQPSFTRILPLKVIVLSNCKPNISSQRSDIRRSIFCTIDGVKGPFDPQYVDKLWAERNSILFHCKRKYEELTINNSSIQVQQDITTDLIENNEESFHDIFDRHFYLDHDSSIKPSEFRRVISQSLMEHNISYEDFRDWLQRYHGIRVQRIKNGPRILCGLSLIVNPSNPSYKF